MSEHTISHFFLQMRARQFFQMRRRYLLRNRLLLPSMGLLSYVTIVILTLSLLLGGTCPSLQRMHIPSAKKLDRVWRTKRRECLESEKCKLINKDENDNCVNECTSLSCFNQVYGSEPLEPGEVDFHRWRQFTLCARKEVAEQKRKQREESYKSRNNL